VTTGVFAVIGVRDASDSKSLDDERTQVRVLAGRYAVDFTSVDYRHLQADFDAAAKNATPDFSKKYLATVEVFAPLSTKGQVVQTTSVDLAGVSSLTSNTAVVLVALKGVATNTRTKLGTQQLFRMQISLEKINGRWLTSNVVPL
jgi:Mce-associated membrane protein